MLLAKQKTAAPYAATQSVAASQKPSENWLLHSSTLFVLSIVRGPSQFPTGTSGELCTYRNVCLKAKPQGSLNRLALPKYPDMETDS